MVASIAPLLTLLLIAAAASAGEPVTLTLTPNRTTVVLGAEDDLGVDVAIEVAGTNAAAYRPSRTFVTVGTLEPPRPAGAPGHFSARYRPPAERFPQVALLVVELTAGSSRVRGVARIILNGLTDLPLRSNPGASVTLRVGDRTFGPVTADHQGHAKIPIEVPPGLRTGLARAVDHTGNVRETEVDLQPAPFRRVLVIAPPTVEAGSFAVVSVLALDAAGERVPAGRLSLRASDGQVHPLGVGALGEARFLLEAPHRVGTGGLGLTAVAAGTPAARADQPLALIAGDPQTLSLSPSTRRLVVGSGAVARVLISAHDQFGNPTSAEGTAALIDRAPAPVTVTAGGQGVLLVAAPPRFDGRDRFFLEVSLGAAHAAQELRLTGGAPAGLTLDVGTSRLVADGHRGTELRVRAVDRHGTPTMVPGLSWETPGGHIRHVRMPHEGEYVAEFVPDRAHDPHREPVAVMASRSLRAAASLEVVPPPARVAAGARAGLFSNLGHAAGPTVFLEALTPIRWRGVRLAIGLAVGYLRDDLTTGGGAAGIPARLIVDQVPVLALMRVRIPLPVQPEISGEAGIGMSFARARLAASPGPGAVSVDASAHAVALETGAEAAFPLPPGRLVFGVRYLWVALGQTSRGDDIRGNSAGVMGDLGYRLIW